MCLFSHHPFYDTESPRRRIIQQRQKELHDNLIVRKECPRHSRKHTNRTGSTVLHSRRILLPRVSRNQRMSSSVRRTQMEMQVICNNQSVHGIARITDVVGVSGSDSFYRTLWCCIAFQSLRKAGIDREEIFPCHGVAWWLTCRYSRSWLLNK